MASDSEGFESAEEDAASRKPRKPKLPQMESNAWNDSDSDGELTNLCEGKGDDKQRKEESPTSVKIECKPELPASCTNNDSIEASGDTNLPSQRSKRPERAPKQPKPRMKLGAVRLGNKSIEKADAKDEVLQKESQSVQRNASKEGNIRMESEASSRSSISSLSKDFEPVLEKLSNLSTSSQTSQENAQSAGWGGWGSWGVNSILSTASSLTTHVSQGISTVTSALETGLGAPDPEELARLAAEEEKALQEENGDQGNTASASGASGSLSFDSVLRMVETTAGGIVSGGLTTLETLGKKTMDVLQEGDPGLKKKRAYFFPDSERPVLSQLLREAKEKAEAESASGSDSASVAANSEKKLHFETLFDDYQGLVHLEALEMLSRQCQMRLQSRLLALSGAQLTELQRTLAQVKELCEFPDEEEETSEECTPAFLNESLKIVADGFRIPLPYEKVTAIYGEEEKWLSEVSKDTTDVRNIHTHAITALAKLAAAAAELFHKTAELLLVKERRDTTEEAKHLVSMTTLLCSCTSALATKFSDAFTAIDSATSDISDSHRSITNIFLEASNSSSYIQDAGNLLVPVLQIGVCK